MNNIKWLLPVVMMMSWPVMAQDVVNKDKAIILNQNINKTDLSALIKTNNALYDVLALTYQNNPTLRAARAEFLALSEQLDQAKSGFLPIVSADGDVTLTNTKTVGNSFINSDGNNVSKSGSLNLNQPLYRGGSTQADVGQAQNVIAAQKFSLSAVEQQTLYEAVVAYMDLFRDKAILDLRLNNEQVVAKELDQAQLRFKVGELTRTDVSQSEARLADAKAGVINAKATVKSDMAVFRQIVGNPPLPDMGYPVISFDMPQNLSAALSLAETNNRDILQSSFVKQAADFQVKSVKGELFPQISAIGRVDKAYDQSDFIEEQRQAAIGVSASIPLYTGGATRSRLRQARKTVMQRAEQINVTKDRVKQEVITNWENWEAAKAATAARQSQVEAATIALEGVKYETEFGERTTLDSLNANQELLSAQVEYITSRRDEIVMQFALARSLGLLVPQNLGFSTASLTAYSPENR